MRKTDRARARNTLSICSLALALTLAIGACGQRGPLYLPDTGVAGGKAGDETPAQAESGQDSRDPENDSEDEKTP